MSKLSANLQKGLVGHWTMDDRDTDNGMLRDRSGNDNHGTINGGIKTSKSGAIGESYEISGDTPYIATSFGKKLGDDIDAFCISLWCKTDLGGRKWLAGWRGNNSPHFNWGLNDDLANSGELWARWRGDAGNSKDLTSSTLINDNSWHHVVFEMDTSGYGAIYVDSELVDSRSDLDTTADFRDIPIWIGEFNDTGSTHGFPWGGKIADCRIYNRVLSEQEINALYNMRSQRTSNI